MKRRKRVKRRPAKRAAKDKKQYLMPAETGYFDVTGEGAERFIMPKRVMDRIDKAPKRTRHELKGVGIPIPSRNLGAPKKKKPE
jgi:hypothetical protein